MALQYYIKNPGYNIVPNSATNIQIQTHNTTPAITQVQVPLSINNIALQSSTNANISATTNQYPSHNSIPYFISAADGIKLKTNTSSTNSTSIGQPPQQHHLLSHPQTQLKQSQLKHPSHHHHQHSGNFHHHHPYYQRPSSQSTSTTNHNSQALLQGHNVNNYNSLTNYKHSVPVHALNQNSNFSAASSSTGGGTTSSHAPTQQSNTTGSSLSPPGASSNVRTTPASGSSSSSTSVSLQNTQSRTTAVNAAKKLKLEPFLTQFYQTERLTFANNHIHWTEDHWKRVVFQDERKFNLDGPDGFSYYFHDLRNYERALSQRPRGNSIYIYLIITIGGPIHLEVTTSKLKAETCVQTILRERNAIAAKLGGYTDFLLQDHNWTSNALPSVQDWLSAEGIKTQKWPTVAHDLNIMEGIWGWLIRDVFDGGRKFSRKDDLIFRVREAWSRLPIELISNLYTTLPERIMQLYYTRGGYTNC